MHHALVSHALMSHTLMSHALMSHARDVLVSSHALMHHLVQVWRHNEHRQPHGEHVQGR